MYVDVLIIGMTPFINCTLGQFSTESQFIQCIMYCFTTHLSFSHAVTVAVLSSAVLSIISTALIISLVWYCAVIKFRKKKVVNIDPHTVSAQQETMLTTFQGNISVQENVAYGQVRSRIRK